MTSIPQTPDAILRAAQESEVQAVWARYLEAGERLRVLILALERDPDHVEFCRKISRAAGKNFLDVLVASYADSKSSGGHEKATR